MSCALTPSRPACCSVPCGSWSNCACVASSPIRRSRKSMMSEKASTAVPSSHGQAGPPREAGAGPRGSADDGAEVVGVDVGVRVDVDVAVGVGVLVVRPALVLVLLEVLVRVEVLAGLGVHVDVGAGVAAVAGAAPGRVGVAAVAGVPADPDAVAAVRVAEVHDLLAVEGD